MATIVQPYNPWREQLALTALGNVAGNIISDLWKNHNQNEQNRKVNAFRGQLNQDLNNNAQNNAVSLTAMGAPDGYNSNPWANAFHKTDSPLTQFDIGTAGIGKTPSIQDIMRGVDSLAATSRFSMINPETIGKIRNDLLQGAYAEMFRNAGNDIQGQMNALTMGAANGVVAPQILTAFGPWAREVYSPYTFHESDLGTNKVISAMNKHTGMSTPATILPVEVSPNTAATLATQRYGYDTNASVNRDRNDISRTELEYTRDQNLREWENPNQTLHTDENGNVRMIHPRTGKATSVTDESGNQVRGTSGHYQIDVQRLNSLDKEYRDLSEEREAYRKVTTSLAYNDEEKEQARKLMKEVEGRMIKNRKEYDKLYNTLHPQRTQTTPTTPQPTPVQPIANTVSGSAPQVIVTAMGATSPDVRQPETPQLPATPTTPPANPTTQNFTDVTSFLGDRSTWQGITQPQTPTTTPTPPEKQKGTVSFPKIAVYDPSRDVNVPADKIVTLSKLYSDYNKYKNELQLPPTFQEFLNNCIRDGVKIDQRTRK